MICLFIGTACLVFGIAIGITIANIIHSKANRRTFKKIR